MAEFKLGRIRFVWKGEWTSSTTYLVDDVISSGGKSYICVVNHTSSSLFETDIGAIPTKWEIVSDGVRWNGDWAPNTYYTPGGLVKYGGLIYLCQESHTSSTFVAPTFLGLEDDLEKWDVFATAFNWIGDWTNGTRYKLNDIVSYGGTTYICNDPHISTPATAVITATGFTVNAGVATLTYANRGIAPYAVGSTITLAGFTPTTTTSPSNNINTTHTVVSCTATQLTFAITGTYTVSVLGTVSGASKLGLEADLSKWDIFNQGVTYLGDWDSVGGTRYKKNDLVSYGASLWVCNIPHTSTGEWLDDDSNWEIFLKGFEFESTWDIAQEYQIGDTVVYGGYSFIAKTNHTGSVPTESPTDWDAFTTGFNFRGDYLNVTEYRVGDVVRYGGYTYLAIADSTGEPVSDGTFWERLNFGVRWTNNSQTYTAVAGTNIIGTGSNATFNVTRNNTVYTVSVNNTGSGYAVNNIIKIPGTSLGGITPANDLILTVTDVNAGAISTVTWTGISVSWKSGVTYILGDVALWGATSFICVQEHVASNLNRPDNDLTGSYWNVLAAGAESAILTTGGDMLYYGLNGPTRLPIGTDGQILRVKNGYPTWAYYGVINNIVYVAPQGVDTLEEGQGLSIDKPWKTIRFATETIDRGYLNPEAKDLLYKNKQFLMKEVSNWVTATYSVTITASSSASNTFTCGSTANLMAGMPIRFIGTTFGGINTTTTYFVREVTSSSQFTISNSQGGSVRTLTTGSGSMTGRLSYNEVKCERDVGLLVEALIYDLSHGGNEDITTAAQSYYTDSGLDYITGNFGNQVLQTIAAYQYFKEIVDNVLNNTAPAVNYQALNGIALNDRAAQHINLALSVTDTAKTDAGALLDIVINGLTAGSSAAIKTSIKGQTTISAKTGTFFEVLPIVVPKNVAIVGDELRSTVVSPNYPIALLANDKTRSLSSLNRLKSVIGDVIQNNSVTPTSGNTTPQVTSLPAGDVGSTTALTRAISSGNVMYDVLNNGIGSEPTLILPNPVGYDTGFLNARTQIVNNFNFLIADVRQFLVNNYTALWSSLGADGQAACQRDIRYILEAIRYDITYGGNTQTLIAGRSYYSYLTLVIAQTEVTATVAAYNHLRTIMLNVAQRLAVTPQAGNTTPQVTSGTGGSLTAAQFAQARVQDVIDWIEDGSSPAAIAPSTAWVNAGLVSAFNELQARKAEIQTDAVGWVRKFFHAVNFDQEICSRDVDYIVDAFGYDIMFGSNFASITAARAYHRGTASAQLVITRQKDASLGLINFLKYKVKSVVATGAVAQAQSAIDDIINTIDGGKLPRFEWPDYSTLDSNVRLARTLIWDNKEFAKAEVIQYITNTYPSLAYDSATCARDVGYLIDALRYDLTYGGNSQTLKAAEAYYSYGITQVLPPAQQTATEDAFTFLRDLLANIAQNIAVTPLQGTVAQVQGDAGTSVGVANSLTTLINQFITTIDNIANKPAVVNPTTTWVSAALLTQQANLQSAKSTLQDQVTEYIGLNYPNLVYDVATCERDIGLIIDALGWDLLFGSNYQSIKAGMSYYRGSASKVLGDQKIATIQAYRFLKGLVKNVVTLNATAVSSVKTNMDIINHIIEFGIGETPEINGTNSYRNSLLSFRATQVLEANKEFLASELAAWTRLNNTYTVTIIDGTADTITIGTNSLQLGDPIVFTGTTTSGLPVNTILYVIDIPGPTTIKVGTVATATTAVNLTTDSTPSLTVAYYFDEDACKRDTRSYIDAIIYDIHYPGNYKATTAAVLYNNAVNGSLTSNMYLTRNGCGIRNQTVVGLSGVLTEENDFGTKRPTAGAYVSLDPGFGPADYKAWVTTKSCYVQNVTTFGTGCVGNKIDGALHLGGNKSMVSNDFTQVLSDGIGVWCTGSGSLTELVSVFSYYGYAGYLAEFGGRIRATNGNSSYGTYGVIAEGTDTYELPISGFINNRNFDASIGNTVTDSTDEILRLEFNNAGTGYTNASYTISGAGFNATAVGDEFRDSAVFETRIVDLNDTNGVGGSNYVTASNAAQGGEVGKITIANTDTALSGVYVGMRIQLTAGTGVGQYANILSYNNGTKEAVIFKDSFAPVAVTATTVTTNLLTTSSTATFYTDMPVVFGGTTFGGITANTIYYVRSGFTSTQFTVSTTVGGGAVTLSTASGSMTMYEAGWDHVIPGKPVVSALDLTTTYIIEPRVVYTAPGFRAISRTVTSATWSGATYGDSRFVAIANGSTNSIFSADGASWGNGGALIDSTQRAVVFGGGEGARAYAVVGGLGGRGAVLQAVLGVPNTTGAATEEQVASVTIIDGGQGYTTPPVIEFVPVSGGTGARATCTVLNGRIDSVTVTIPGSGYQVAPTVSVRTDCVTSVVVERFGRNYASGTTTITLLGGGFTSQAVGVATVSLNGGITQIRLRDSNNVLEGAVGYLGYSGAGYTSVPSVIIADTNSKYISISGSSNTTCTQTPSGLGSAWTAGGNLPANNFSAITYGVVSGTPLFVAVGGTSSAARTQTGASWTSSTIPNAGPGTYTDVAFGNGVFVAISSGNNVTAISTNGSTWTAGGNLPATATWTSITYGNGRFVAVANGPSRSVAYSYDKGATWYASPAGLPSLREWSKVVYGQGQFIAFATGINVAATSPDGVTWTSRTMPTNSQWRVAAFGNPSDRPTFVALTTGTAAAQVRTGAQAQGRMRVATGVVTEVRMIEPGSGYPEGTITATNSVNNNITTTDTSNLVDSQPVYFTGMSAYGLAENTVYYVIGASIVTDTSFRVSATAGSATPVAVTTGTGLTGTYQAGPIVTQVDPNRVRTAALRVRLGDGVLGNPSFTNRGAENTTATTVVSGDGKANLYQPGSFINVKGLYEIPLPGANVVFSSIPGKYFKLVAVTNVLGIPGNYTAQFQINPDISVLEAPNDGDAVSTTLLYSQVRLTGHDFLYIGTGNFSQTNYPNVDISTAIQDNQELFTGGGRVFFTSTDQDGNFNVGNLFGVQQATGTATLNASAFNLSGLQSLQLGSVAIGIGSAVITQFSTDPFFTADSDNIVPTQRAIRAYITSQIGGGASSLNVNTLTAGVVFVAGSSITTTTGVQLSINAKMNFTGGIDGAPVALAFFNQR